MMILFKPYSASEAFQILKDRAQQAFKPNVISDESLSTIAKATEDMADIRLGMSMLLTAGQSAECGQKSTIDKEDVQLGIENAQRVKSLATINDLSKKVKKHLGKTIDF